MLKKIISLLVLAIYLHGMSGYTMSFHKCMFTGFEKVYTGYQFEDPCAGMPADCQDTAPHFETANCCDIQQTLVQVDDDSNLSSFKAPIYIQVTTHTLVQSYLEVYTSFHYQADYSGNLSKPPDLTSICTFRI